MNDKRVDNTFINYRKAINNYEDQVDIEKQKLKKVEFMQDELISLNKNMETCIELLSKSIKGSNTTSRFEDMHNANRVFLLKSLSMLDEKKEELKKGINHLNEKKENMIEQNKQKTEMEG